MMALHCRFKWKNDEGSLGIVEKNISQLEEPNPPWKPRGEAIPFLVRDGTLQISALDELPFARQVGRGIHMDPWCSRHRHRQR